MDVVSLRKWLAEPRPALIDAVAEGVREHVATLRTRGIEFSGYALHAGTAYNTPGIVAVLTTEAEIQACRTDDRAWRYRYWVDNWEHWEHKGFTTANALLAEINARFKSLHSRTTGDYRVDEFEVNYANVLLECITQGLETAKGSGVFGGSDPFLVVWFSDSDPKIMAAPAQRLNTAEVVAEFLRMFRS